MNTTTDTLTLGRPGRGTTTSAWPPVGAGEAHVIVHDPKGDYRWHPAAGPRPRVRRRPVRRGLRTLGLSTWILLASGGTAWAQGTVSGTGGSSRGGGGGGGVPDLAQNASDNAISTVQIVGVAVLSVVLAIPLIKAAANKKFGEAIALLLIGGLVGLFVMDPKGTITTVQTFAKQFSS